ncbi:LysM peptidoglycan-binding domain-containing protein [Intrasporangium sp. DVR]|uniref:LysM peptidoglycan-binding domain-containing protein n=1 Tax=Intrasporangium sp. DVR TaxID=3127867 RepID=UPI00333F8E9A
MTSAALAWALAQLAVRGWPARSSSGPATVEEVLSGGLLWGAVALTGWLAVTFSIVALGTAPGALGAVFRRLADRLAPHFARRMLALSLGVSVGTVVLPAPMAIAAADTPSPHAATEVPVPLPGFAPSGSATAADQHRGSRSVSQPGTPNAPRTPGLLLDESRGDVAPAPAVPRPGWVPDRPFSVTRPETTRLLGSPLRPSGTVVDTVTVRRGDSLWTIAERHLGPGASTADVAAEWPRWFEANRDVIGDDPDVILPGQLLRAPVAEVTR